MFQGKEFFSKILIVIKRSKWNWAWWRKNMLLVPWYSFLHNRFYSLVCLQRPPASVGVYERQPILIESSGDEKIWDSMPTPVRSDFADHVLFALTDANESQKINLKFILAKFQEMSGTVYTPPLILFTIVYIGQLLIFITTREFKNVSPVSVKNQPLLTFDPIKKCTLLTSGVC